MVTFVLTVSALGLSTRPIYHAHPSKSLSADWGPVAIVNTQLAALQEGEVQPFFDVTTPK
jgi:hypothetical protein